MTDTASPAWLDAQYDNRARVPEHPKFLSRWTADSARTRGALDCRLDIAYGDTAAERLDLFLPAAAAAKAGAAAPILVFIHGGYWRWLDKSDFSFVADPFVRAGALVAVPNYGLCPAVSMETIALQSACALAWLHRHAGEHGGDASRLVVAGHSAGGHLAAMLLCADGRKLGSDLPPRLVTRAVSLSGLFDLEPIRRTPFLHNLGLTEASVRRLSPARFAAPRGAMLHAWVGGLESEEFRRQNDLVFDAWGDACVPVCAELPGRHHFDIVDELVTPGSPAHEATLDLLSLPVA